MQWSVESYQAFTAQVLPEIDALHRAARTITQQAADAEDLVQETLLRAFLAIDQFDGRYPRAWLLTILRNTARKQYRDNRVPILQDPVAGDFDIKDPGPSAERTVIDSIFDSELESAFKALSAEHKEIIALVDLQGFAYAEAAQSLGIPLGTVMSRLYRARNQLRVQLMLSRASS